MINLTDHQKSQGQVKRQERDRKIEITQNNQ